MADNCIRIEKLTQTIKDQERIINNIQDSISQLHMENITMRQRLLDNQNNLDQKHLKILSSKIKDFYLKKVGKNWIGNDELTISEMIVYLEEIFMTLGQEEEDGGKSMGRSSSPVFTFAEERNQDEDKFVLQLSSIDSTQSYVSDTNSEHLWSKKSQGQYKEFKTPQYKLSKS